MIIINIFFIIIVKVNSFCTRVRDNSSQYKIQFSLGNSKYNEELSFEDDSIVICDKNYNKSDKSQKIGEKISSKKTDYFYQDMLSLSDKQISPIEFTSQSFIDPNYEGNS